jgi:hypothetical protein
MLDWLDDDTLLELIKLIVLPIILFLLMWVCGVLHV